jgi:putative hydrolase of the HAD superfamily
VALTTVFFDLDGTLYPPTSGLWPVLKARITRYMIERLKIPESEVPGLRESYFRRYGTTLRGLQANGRVDTEEYLAFVHDVPLEQYLHPDPIQQSALKALPTKNLIFTNADAIHARRVLRTLHIEPHFEGIIDVHSMHPHCKPSPAAFELAMRTAGEPQPDKCALIDDLPHTTRAASEAGMFSVLFWGQPEDENADAVCSDWSRLPNLLNGKHA